MFPDSHSRAQVTHTSMRKRSPEVPHQQRHSNIFRMCDRMTRNFLCVALLVVCIYAVRTAQYADENVLAAAARSMTESPWEENLGRIQFVSHMFPETQAVFWSENHTPELAIQSCDTFVHTWSEDEPYISIRTDSGSAYALGSGTITTIAADHNQNQIVTVDHGNGYTSTYYGLSNCLLSEGSHVAAGDTIGHTASSNEMVVEIKQYGLPIDPAPLVIQGDERL